MQKPREAARRPRRPAAAPEPVTPAPLSPLEAKERAVFETLAGAAPASAASRTEPRVPAMEEMHTVLAVDDDAAVLRLMRRRSCSPASTAWSPGRTGREALAKVRETMPDLVILDGMLPEVHGFEICRQLKSSERFRHIPVIMVSAVHTGWRFAADVKEKYGADDYLEKPFEPADLLRRVETLLNRAPSGVAARLGGRRPPAPQGRRHRPEAGPSRRRHRRLRRAAWPSTSSTTCSTTTWP